MKSNGIAFLLLLCGLCGQSQIGLATEPPASTPDLNLENYLSQVSSSHLGYRAAQSTSSGAELRAQEGQHLFAPTAFATLQHFTDGRLPSSSFSPSETNVTTYSLGISQMTNFGLQAKLSYTGNRTNLVGGSTALIPLRDYYDTGPALELSQSLWRNAFGREVRATRNLLESSALATSYGESYKSKLVLLEGELTYWRLALARDIVSVQEVTLQRAQVLKEWNARRERLQLGDRSDLLQAEAAVQLRELELRQARDEERTAARAFNSLRGVDSDEVTEKLATLKGERFTDVAPPPRADLRDDVRAAQKMEESSVSNARISIEKNRPSLDLYATLGLNGKDSQLGTSFDQSLTTKYRNATVGVRFTAPLDFGTSSDIRDGYRKEEQGAHFGYERRLFEQDQEWRDLTTKLEEAKKRLQMADTLVKLQAQKLENEKERNKKGRSTTYQVLLFEQDYSAAQLNKIRIQAEVLRIVAQLKTFRGPTL